MTTEELLDLMTQATKRVSDTKPKNIIWSEGLIELMEKYKKQLIKDIEDSNEQD